MSKYHIAKLKLDQYKGFKMRAPMMYSISGVLSGFVESYEGV